MNARHPTADQVFILRFWRELHNGEGPRWRAQVRDVNTRQLQMADDVEAAFAIVRSFLGAIETSGVDPAVEQPP